MAMGLERRTRDNDIPFIPLKNNDQMAFQTPSKNKDFSFSVASSSPSIQENKPSPLEHSYESSTQKIEELDDLFTEVDRKPASELAKLKDHLPAITVKTHVVNAYVDSFVATAESAIDDLPEEKQDSARQKIAEAKESANDMNNGVKMYHSIADAAMNKNVSMYELIVETINAISRGNMDLTSKVASKYNKYNTAVSNFIVNMHKLTESKGSDVVMNRAKVEQELRQLIIALIKKRGFCILLRMIMLNKAKKIKK